MFDILLEEPRDTPWNKWACGIGFPVLLTVWAARVMYVLHFSLYLPSVGRRSLGRVGHHIDLTGTEAWWLALAMFGGAAFAHFHFFWTNHSQLVPYADLGKVASMITVVVGMGVVVFNMARPF
ncbi:MAG: hypothetical protein K8T89_18900 [Planctomycetes bacterium]|nr:hypothetical protein [Planctomycetota bacterium]